MKIKDVKRILGVTNRTVNNYIKSGKIRYKKINTNHYIYNDDDVYALVGVVKTNKKIVTYGRVSSSKQKEDLISQNKRLYEFAISNGYKLNMQYFDVKSGMDFNNRKEFNKLLIEVIEGNIDIIIVENKDRLCRFGFDLFENICKQYGTRIIVTTNVENKSYEQELTDDLVSIIHYFSMKSYSNRRKLNKIKCELLSNCENV